MKIKFVLLLLILTTALKAEVSQELIGTWTVDKEATKNEFKEYPKALKPFDKKIESAIDSMSNISQVLTKENLKILMAGKELISFKVINQKEIDGNKVIEVTTKQKGKEIKVSVTFIPRKNGSFTIKSSATEVMDILIWRKKQKQSDSNK